jgi:hypothetical protein
VDSNASTPSSTGDGLKLSRRPRRSSAGHLSRRAERRRMKIQATVAIAFLTATVVVALVLLAKGCQNEDPSTAVISSSQRTEGRGAAVRSLVSEPQITPS